MMPVTLDCLVAASTEFVCETWGQGEATLSRYAPVTREGATVWLHPTCAREATWAEITGRATRIWRVCGSLWNPRGFVLVWDCCPFNPAPRHE